MGLLGNLFGQQKGLTAREAKTLKLVAALSAEKKHVDESNNFGFSIDEEIVDKLAETGTPTAIPALQALSKRVDSFLDTMAKGREIAPSLWIEGGEKNHNVLLAKYVLALKSKIGRVIAKLESEAGESTQDARDVTFSIPCGVCGYKTNVSVKMDWGGHIVSGTGTEHEFRCLNCDGVFRVSNDALKVHTDRFA